MFAISMQTVALNVRGSLTRSLPSHWC